MTVTIATIRGGIVVDDLGAGRISTFGGLK